LVDELWVMMNESGTSPVHIENQMLFRYSSLLFVLGVVEHLGSPTLDQVLKVDDVNRF